MRRLIAALICCAAIAGARADDANSPQTRAAYARAIGHSLLERGLDLQVFAEEQRDTRYPIDAFPVYPRLILFGPMNAPLAYRIITAANLLSDAKGHGFAGVRFFAPDGFYDFDLSKGGLPDCDSTGRVCLR